MVYDRGFSTYYIATSSGILSDLGVLFFECDGALLPPRVVSYCRGYLRSFGQPGFRYVVRVDWSEGSCQMLECRETQPSDFRSKTGRRDCYTVWGNS